MRWASSMLPAVDGMLMRSPRVGDHGQPSHQTLRGRWSPRGEPVSPADGRCCGLSDTTTRVRMVNDRLVWVDCEMTGLSLATDKLIEIAALVTDSDLNILGDGIDVVIHATDDELAAMPEVVVAMHAKSGLTERVRQSTVTLEA